MVVVIALTDRVQATDVGHVVARGAGFQAARGGTDIVGPQTTHAVVHSRENPPDSWRIDVVAIEMDWKGKASRIEHIENAVGEY